MMWLAKLGLSGVSQAPMTTAAIAAVVIGAWAFWVGYQLADGQWQQKRAEALERAIEERDLAQARADDLAVQYLQAVNKTRVVYRDVLKKIPTYRDPGDCRITADGMRELACFLRPADCATGTATADP